MAGFFPIHPGIGGGGGQNPDTAFIGAAIAGNTITFHRQNGQTHPVDLSQIIPDATKESLKNIRVDGKNLVLTKVDNSETMVDLTQLLSASNISFNSANTGLASTDVQGAIVEVNDKVQNAYTRSDYDPVNGQLTLTKANGQGDVLNLGVPFNGVREFTYNPATQIIDVVDHTNTPVRVDLSVFAEDTDLVGIREKLVKEFKLVGNELVLTLEDNTEHRVDLTNILGGDITDVVYNDVAYTLTVTKKGQPQPTVYDLSNLIGVREFSYDENTQKITVLDHNNAPVEVDLNMFARLDRDNVFIGQNTFNEAYLLGKTPFIETQGTIQSDGYAPDRYCGLRTISTHHDPQTQSKYVSAIKIRVLDGLNVGDTVAGVCVAEVEKRDVRANDIFVKNLVFNGSFIVEADKDYIKCIYVPIQKTYHADTYFLIGQSGNRELREARYVGVQDFSQFVNGLMFNSLPQEGQPINHHNGNGHIIIHSLVEDDINIREELEALNNKFANTGSVKTINNQQPDAQGNINWSVEDTADFINFKVETQIVGTLDYATQPEVDAIKNTIIVF